MAALHGGKYNWHQEDSEELKGEEDERAHNIDSDISIKEMREGKKDGDNKEIVSGCHG
ncbi:MAG: hypothetical protein H7223_02270 [Pedobacter sp.]|nr:hypothetical protein [Pedobacter sp.]